MGEKKVERPDPNLHPKIRAYQAKIRKADKLKAKSKKGLSFGTLLAAVCCMGIGITPLNIGEISYASIGWLTSMMQQKESYETDIKSLLAGASKKKVKPKYWIRNLKEEE